MRILICGGRIYRDWGTFNKVMLEACKQFSDFYKEEGNWLPSDITIIHGNALGADAMADQWAVVNWVAGLEVFKADWNQYGRQAGYIRNKRMLEEGKPDVIIAFPGGAGTEMMVKLATEAGKPIWRVDLDGNITEIGDFKNVKTKSNT